MGRRLCVSGFAARVSRELRHRLIVSLRMRWVTKGYLSPNTSPLATELYNMHNTSKYTVSKYTIFFKTDRKAQKILRIAQISPLVKTIPPGNYGGTERAVYYLVEALVKRGHKVWNIFENLILIYKGDSFCFQQFKYDVSYTCSKRVCKIFRHKYILIRNRKSPDERRFGF